MSNKPTNNRKRAFFPVRWRQCLARGFHTVDQVLRHTDTPIQNLSSEPATDRRHDEFENVLSLRTVACVVLLCGSIYGTGMGSYAAVTGERSWNAQTLQMCFSATKVPILIGVTLIVSLPSFYVVNLLLGLGDDFATAVKAILAAQAGLTIILTSLLPLTLFVYISAEASQASYSAAILGNAMAFGISSISAQWLLRGYYEPLIRRNSRHRMMIRIWIVVYAFVGVQAGYVLRPFIGDPSHPTEFLRRDSFQNAYVKIVQLMGNVLGW